MTPEPGTKRLSVRRCKVEDAEALFEILSDVEVMRFWSGPPHRSIDETRAHIHAMADSGWQHWVFAKSPGGTAIGTLATTERRTGVAEIGYLLARKHWSNGYATEAVTWLIDLLFSEGSRRICADTDPDNEASNRLLAKLAFKNEGHLREEWLTHIGTRDSFVWGLLRNDWLSRSG